MDSDFVDTAPEWVDLDTSKSLVVGTEYQLQCTGGGMPEFGEDAPAVYLVIAAAEPSDRRDAYKSATIMLPGRDAFLYTPATGRSAWVCSPGGDSSLSINVTS